MRKRLVTLQLETNNGGMKMNFETIRETLENSEMKLFTGRGNIRAIGNGKLYINGGTMKEGGSDIPMNEHTVIEIGKQHLSIYFFRGDVNKVNWDEPFFVSMITTEMYTLRTEKLESLDYHDWSK